MSARPEDKFAASAGLRTMPRLNSGRQAEVVALYLRTLENMARVNGAARSWCYSAPGARTVQTSRLFVCIEDLYRLRDLLTTASDDLVLYCPGPVMVPYVRALATSVGNWTVQIKPADRISWITRRIGNALERPIDALRFLRTFIKLACTKPDVPISQDADIILVTTFWPHRIDPTKPYRDVFFGDLPDKLREAGHRVLLVGQSDGDETETSARVSAMPAGGLCPFSRAVGWRDVIATFGELVSQPLKIATKETVLGQSIRPLVSWDMAAGRFFWPGRGIIFERALGRILRNNPVKTLFYPYENNAWERAFARAGHGSPQPPRIVGCQHCAVLPSHLKHLATAEDLPSDRPDLVITTGPAASDFLARQMKQDPTRIKAGCTLRLSQFYEVSPRTIQPSKRATTHILVLLEGLLSMRQFLGFLHQGLSGSKGFSVSIRAHPTLPLDQLLPGTPIILDGQPFAQSTHETLYDAALDADVIIYQGSTAAMEAVALGVPVVYCDMGSALSSDPLIDCDALKAVVSEPVDLAAACTRLAALPADVYRSEANRARGYFEGYFAKSSAENLNTYISADTPLHQAEPKSIEVLAHN
jgi:hypothetical protein